MSHQSPFDIDVPDEDGPGNLYPVDFHGKTQQFTTNESAAWSNRANSYMKVASVCKSLPSGLFFAEHSYDSGWYLTRQEINVDSLIDFEDSETHDVIVEIEKFWAKDELYRKMGFLHKRGILLWGEPGSGKTSIIQQIIKKIVDKGGIAITAGDPEGLISVVQSLRFIEPDRHLMIMFEDMDDLVEKYGEEKYLSLLDGEYQVNRILFLATTNYPEKLDKRIIDRPSRFDTIKFIGMPNAKNREIYFRTKLPDASGDEIKKLVSVSDGFGIAALKEIIVSVYCLDFPLEQVIAKLEKMAKRSETSESVRKNKNFGFDAFFAKQTKQDDPE